MCKKNLCTTCKHRCVIKYEFVWEINRAPHNWFTKLFWFGVLEALAQTWHRWTHGRYVESLHVEHKKSITNFEMTTYFFTYKPINVCNCSRAIDRIIGPYFKYIPYRTIKKQLEIKRQYNCGWYKNAGAKKCKVFEASFRRVKWY